MEFHGENGKPLRTSLKDEHGLKWLGVVTVKGTIHKDSRGNVSVIADRLLVVE